MQQNIKRGTFAAFVESFLLKRYPRQTPINAEAAAAAAAGVTAATAGAAAAAAGAAAAAAGAAAAAAGAAAAAAGAAAAGRRPATPIETVAAAARPSKRQKVSPSLFKESQGECGAVAAAGSSKQGESSSSNEAEETAGKETRKETKKETKEETGDTKETLKPPLWIRNALLAAGIDISHLYTEFDDRD